MNHGIKTLSITKPPTGPLPNHLVLSQQFASYNRYGVQAFQSYSGISEFTSNVAQSVKVSASELSQFK